MAKPDNDQPRSDQAGDEQQAKSKGSDGETDDTWSERIRTFAEPLVGEDRLKNRQAVRQRADEVTDLGLADLYDNARLVERARFRRARRDLARERSVDPKSPATTKAQRREQATVERLGSTRLLADIAKKKVNLDKEVQ